MDFSDLTLLQLAGGATEPLARFIYMIIGIAGLLILVCLFEHWRLPQ